MLESMLAKLAFCSELCGAEGSDSDSLYFDLGLYDLLYMAWDLIFVCALIIL